MIGRQWGQALWLFIQAGSMWIKKILQGYGIKSQRIARFAEDRNVILGLETKKELTRKISASAFLNLWKQ